MLLVKKSRGTKKKRRRTKEGRHTSGKTTAAVNSSNDNWSGITIQVRGAQTEMDLCLERLWIGGFMEEWGGRKGVYDT